MTNREDEILANIGPVPADCSAQTVYFGRDSLLVSTQGGGAADPVTQEDEPATVNGGDAETPNANGIEHTITSSSTSSTTNPLITTTNITSTSTDTTTNHETNQNVQLSIPSTEGDGATVGAPTPAAAALSELWTSAENPPSSASSGFSDDDSLAGTDAGDPKTIEQIVEMVKERGRQGLIKEYAEIRARAPDGTFVNAR